VTRVGTLDDGLLYDGFEDDGRRARADILSSLPRDWTFEGKRVLDFGCGAGRVLRQFLDEAAVADMRGCDIDSASIQWLEENLDPPFTVVRNDEEPPLPWPNDSFDLIWALSVFTHITERWSAWLLELHRLLDDGGLLFATFLGPGMLEQVGATGLDGDRAGMSVLHPTQTWDRGGPIVLHSPWWIVEHWGRAFEIESIHDSGFMSPTDPEAGHGYVLLRKKAVTLRTADLERIDPREPREIAALQHAVERLRREVRRLDHAREHAEARAQNYERSVSWRATRPLRWARRLLRRRLNR